MKALLIVLFALCLHTTPAERLDIALDIQRQAFPEWEENYRAGEFDCSEMSAFTAEYLSAWGIPAEVKKGKVLGQSTSHAWVEVGKEAVECTSLVVVPTSHYRRYNVRFTGIDMGGSEWDWWNVKYLEVRDAGN